MSNGLKFKPRIPFLHSDDIRPDNGAEGARPSTPRRVEFLAEPAPIDLRGPPTPTAVLAEKRRSRIQWSDQDNDPGAPRKSRSMAARPLLRYLASAAAAVVAIGLGVAAAVVLLPGDASTILPTFAAAAPEEAPAAGPREQAPVAEATAAATPEPAAAPEPTPVQPTETVTAQSSPAPAEPSTGSIRSAPPATLPATPPTVPAGKSTRVLQADDPRWAAAAGAGPDAPNQERIFEAPPSVSAKAAAPAAAGPDVADEGGSPDETLTAAVSPRETELSSPEPETASPAPKAAAAVPLPTPNRQAKVTTAVNMRTGKSNRSGVIGVVPAGATVGIVRCDVWCEMVYKGRRGFIFNDFVQGRTAAASAKARPASAKAKPATAAKPAAAAKPELPKPDEDEAVDPFNAPSQSP